MPSEKTIRLQGTLSHLTRLFKVSEAGIQLAAGDETHDSLQPGLHSAYIFETQADKQAKMFAVCAECVDRRNSYLLYIAGKQGVKGIRLSLKDIGFDVASYERNNQFKIVDSEQWFLTTGRLQSFKPIDDVYNQFREVSNSASRAGFSQVTIISETDMLVRKGFYKSYKEFDIWLGNKLKELNAALLCGFDKRELLAAGILDSTHEVYSYHSELI